MSNEKGPSSKDTGMCPHGNFPATCQKCKDTGETATTAEGEGTVAGSEVTEAPMAEKTGEEGERSVSQMQELMGSIAAEVAKDMQAKGIGNKSEETAAVAHKFFDKMGAGYGGQELVKTGKDGLAFLEKVYSDMLEAHKAWFETSRAKEMSSNFKKMGGRDEIKEIENLFSNQEWRAKRILAEVRKNLSKNK